MQKRDARLALRNPRDQCRANCIVWWQPPSQASTPLRGRSLGRRGLLCDRDILGVRQPDGSPRRFVAIGVHRDHVIAWPELDWTRNHAHRWPAVDRDSCTDDVSADRDLYTRGLVRHIDGRTDQLLDLVGDDIGRQVEAERGDARSPDRSVGVSEVLVGAGGVERQRPRCSGAVTGREQTWNVDGRELAAACLVFASRVSGPRATDHRARRIRARQRRCGELDRMQLESRNRRRRQRDGAIAIDEDRDSNRMLRSRRTRRHAQTAKHQMEERTRC